MNCPSVQGDATQAVERVTALGYRLFHGHPCRQAHLQRADEHARQPRAGAHGHRVARGALALVVQTQPARSGQDVAGRGLHRHARSRQGVGGSLRPAAHGPPA